MNGDLELARELTRIVASTAGVIDVFPSGPPVQSATLSVVNLTTSTNVDAARVAVTRANGTVTLRATIGVNSEHPVRETIRGVSDAIRKHLIIAGLDSSTEIEVRVSYIEWRPESHDDSTHG